MSRDPTSKVRSPTLPKWLGITPTYSVWLANSQIETPAPINIATGPAQLAYFLSNSSRSVSSVDFLRRRNMSQNTTASHGPIQ